MKKRLVTTAVAAITALCAVNASAFTFPDPDWGALLKERQKMINEVDFELYTEGSIDSAPYYGAKYEPRGGAYIGMITEQSNEYRPLGSYLTYIEDMGQPDFYYPANQMIRSDNVITMAGWTINDINSINYDTMRSVLQTLNSYNKPIIVRFANEMNTNPSGDEPSKYVEVFRTVADMVHEYDNLAVCWSPTDLGALNRGFELYYPGDEYVDWVGVSCYTKKYFGASNVNEVKDTEYFMTGDYGWATNRIKPFMKFLEENNINKPVMISEGGVATDVVYGDNMDDWARPRLRNMLYSLVMRYPQIKMINYFNKYQNESEIYTLDNHDYAKAIYKEAASSGAYIRAYDATPDFVFRKASDGETLIADASGNVPLYTLAYIPHQPEFTVNYSVDGNWFGMSDSIPYKTQLNISGLSDGAHKLKISGYYQEKEYTFYKRGSAIRFGAEPDVVVPEASGIKVVLNGHTMSFDQPPVIIDERTLVPMRAIFESLGAEVIWNGDTRTVTAIRPDKIITMQIDNNLMYVNGAVLELDVPPQIVNDFTMVPVRAVSESLDCTVNWDGDTQTVYITGQIG
ncbi:MAG: hypothetical protein J1G06_07975 [Oscillospiraceae bacterium]|nr:hypothetical protein [Oscillospiraceae bacterium]